jgi:23S rRNA pseudouridine2605 synthase
MSAERIQKILARAGVASRRKAEELIEEGRVTINGRVATLGEKADPETDHLKLDGKRIEPQSELHYLVLNKPVGVMSTVSDPEGRPTVMDLVPEKYRKALVPVGRLDFNTEGLLLLTDDGDLAQRVAHPRYGCTKVYEVKVKDRPAPEDLAKLRTRGAVVEGRRVVPVRLEPLQVPGPREGKNTWWTVELAQGRTRQIREMFFRLGHPVQKLRRVAIGPLRDPKLPVGEVRELTPGEVTALRNATRGARKTKKNRVGRPGAVGQAGPKESTGARGSIGGRAKAPGKAPGGRTRSGGGTAPGRSRSGKKDRT